MPEEKRMRWLRILPGEMGHLTGDVLLNLLVGGVLLWLRPR